MIRLRPYFGRIEAAVRDLFSEKDPGLVLVSLDIDGTLEVGKPPGPLALDDVVGMQQTGFTVGSSSDRTLQEQSALWEDLGMTIDFVSRKHELAQIRQHFLASRFIHIGDTPVDASYAAEGDFEFRLVSELPLQDAFWWRRLLRSSCEESDWRLDSDQVPGADL